MHQMHSDLLQSRPRYKICKFCNLHITNVRTHKQECSAQYHGKFHHSLETKQLLSRKRKEYLYLHPDQHPWKRHEKFLSVPCEYLKTYLTKCNVSFDAEVSFPELSHNYSVDIYLPLYNTVIEVNGNQHYDANGLKEYYAKRHAELESIGLTVYEIHYSKVYDTKFIDELLYNILHNEHTIAKIDFVHKISKRERAKQHLIESDPYYFQHLCKNGVYRKNKITNDEWNARCIKITTCGVDLLKFGWLVKVCAATGYTRRQVTDTIKHFNIIVYKRKYNAK